MRAGVRVRRTSCPRTRERTNPPGPGRVAGSAVSLLGPGDVEPGAACYLCGPPAMVEAAREALCALGAGPRQIRSERYLPGG